MRLASAMFYCGLKMSLLSLLAYPSQNKPLSTQYGNMNTVSIYVEVMKKTVILARDALSRELSLLQSILSGPDDLKFRPELSERKRLVRRIVKVICWGETDVCMEPARID